MMIKKIFKKVFLIGSFFLFLKTYIIYFYFLWLRGALPRYRYDQLMGLCWKTLLPFVLVLVILRIIMFLDFNF